MEVFLEILKFALPSIFLLLLAYLMLSNFMDNEENRRLYFLKKETQKSALPIRLQAYERITLFLERISPNSLLVRVPAKGLKVRDYQQLLVQQVRSEFEYNLSQQIYVSEEAWRMVVHAKSATVGIINKIAGELDPNSDGVELGKSILNYSMEMETFPTKKALNFLKSEVQRDF